MGGADGKDPQGALWPGEAAALVRRRTARGLAARSPWAPPEFKMDTPARGPVRPRKGGKKVIHHGRRAAAKRKPDRE